MSENTTNENARQAPSCIVPAAPGTVGLPYRAFPFRAKQWRNAALAAVADKAGYPNRGDKYAACGRALGFGLDAEGRHLVAANFCNQRFCPTCTARLAKKNARQLGKVLTVAQERTPGLRFVFLTLTLRNCDASALPSTVVRLLEGWKRLMRSTTIKRAVLGSFRALEVTRNHDTGMYHPHLHAILAVPASYFDAGSPLYISHDDLMRAWGRALRVDYMPAVRISALYSKGEERDRRRGETDTAAAVAEAAKYSVKDSDICAGGDDAADVYRAMLDALHGKRLTAFAGYLRAIARELKAEDLESADTIDADEDHDTTEAERMAYSIYERWAWGLGVRDYVMEDTWDNA